VSFAKTAEPIEMAFGIWTRVSLGKHVLGGVHTGATWRIPLNRPCATAMRPAVKLLWPLDTIHAYILVRNVEFCSVAKVGNLKQKIKSDIEGNVSLFANTSQYCSLRRSVLVYLLPAFQKFIVSLE